MLISSLRIFMKFSHRHIIITTDFYIASSLTVRFLYSRKIAATAHRGAIIIKVRESREEKKKDSQRKFYNLKKLIFAPYNFKFIVDANFRNPIRLFNHF